MELHPASEGGQESSQAPSPGEVELSPRSQASAEAFRELALALRTSVEAMHGVRELQAELVTALKRQDRSELILQSTQSLNDTFRGLATIQRELLRRLDQSPKEPRGSNRLIPLMLLGLLVVFLGGTFLVLDVLGRMDRERAASVANSAQANQDALQAFRDGKAEGQMEVDDSVNRLREQIGEWEERDAVRVEELENLKAEKSDAEAELRTLQTTIDNLSGQVRTAQTEVLARRALEDELRDVTTRLAVTEPRLQDLEIELQNERAEIARLRKRFGGQAVGLPEPEPAAPAVVPGAQAPQPVSVESPAAQPSVQPTSQAERDPGLLTKIRERLNQMLDASSMGRSDMWQVTSIGGVTTSGLDGVVLRRYDRRTGRLLDQVDAQEAQIWVDRNRRAVDLQLRGGSLVRGGRRSELPPGAARQVIADGEMTRLWSQSGLLFLRFR